MEKVIYQAYPHFYDRMQQFPSLGFSTIKSGKKIYFW